MKKRNCRHSRSNSEIIQSIRKTKEEANQIEQEFLELHRKISLLL